MCTNSLFHMTAPSIIPTHRVSCFLSSLLPPVVKRGNCLNIKDAVEIRAKSTSLTRLQVDLTNHSQYVWLAKWNLESTWLWNTSESKVSQKACDWWCNFDINIKYIIWQRLQYKRVCLTSNSSSFDSQRPKWSFVQCCTHYLCATICKQDYIFLFCIQKL